MDVFISWSGDRSKNLAESLRNWLPKVIQNLKPWISVSDVEKGSRWLKDVSEKLEGTNFGILCLTPENLKESWILFEAGALSKALGSSFVCPILFGLEPSAITGPLSQFQATRLQRDDMLKLIKTINKRLDKDGLSPSQLEESFDMWWPKLEKEINKIPDASLEDKSERSERDILEEILNIVRTLWGQSDLYDKTSKLLTTLTPREEKILRMRFGIGEKPRHSVEDISNNFGVTRERIRQIEAKALRKLGKQSLVNKISDEEEI